MRPKVDFVILAFAIVTVIFISGCVEQQQTTPPPGVSASVKIQSATATPLEIYTGGCECAVEISGTATLPVYDPTWDLYSVSFGGCSSDIGSKVGVTCGATFMINGIITCPDWDSDKYGCSRVRQDQPAIGEWNLVFNADFEKGETENYYAFVYMGTEAAEVRDSVDISCC